MCQIALDCRVSDLLKTYECFEGLNIYQLLFITNDFSSRFHFIKALCFHEKSVSFDDGSTDASLERAESLLDEYSDSRFQLYTKENGGLSSARNYGIEKAKFEWILPLDDGSIVPHFSGK